MTLQAIIKHFSKLFNYPSPSISDLSLIPTSRTLSPYFTASLIAPITEDNDLELNSMILKKLKKKTITEEENKSVVFLSRSSSAPGPNGFSFEFYKNT